jgi:subtilisin family serine protease
MKNKIGRVIGLGVLLAGMIGLAFAQNAEKEKNLFYAGSKPISEYVPGIDYVPGEVLVVVPPISTLATDDEKLRERIEKALKNIPEAAKVVSITKLARTKATNNRICGGKAVRLRYSGQKILTDTLLTNLKVQLDADPDLGDYTEAPSDAGGRPPSLPPEDTTLTNAKMNRVQAQALTNDAKGIIVAVLDSGLSPHMAKTIDVAPQVRFDDGIVGQVSFFDNFGIGTTQRGHGTQAAGIITAKPTIPGTGIAQNAKILPLQVCNSKRNCSGLDVLTAICYAASFENELERPADVINMSLGGFVGSRTTEKAILDARDAGSVIVMAAGNSRNPKWKLPPGVDPNSRMRFLNDPVYPAAFSSGFSSDSDGLISVGSVAKNEIGAALSDFSTWNQNVDFVAPGENLDLYRPNGISDADHSGTSFSAPFVSALAAIIKHTDPTMSPADVEDVLRSDDIPGDTVTLDCSTPATPTPGCGSLVAPTTIEVKQFKF